MANVRILDEFDSDTLILVDDADKQVGLAPKMDVHRRGLKHRALSVLIRDTRGRMLMQQRAAGKYHSGGLWTNACCSHPRPGEAVEKAAARRLLEEMGVDCQDLTKLFVAHYRAPVSNGLIEDELVHVFAGTMETGAVAPDYDEVGDWKWMAFDEVKADVAAHPERYSAWMRHYLDKHGDAIAAWMRG
jgi:isopentenyl-diphosphate delta-isomerase